MLYGAFPHAHYRGASSKFFLIEPNGKKTLLVSLPHYDFNWQREYNFVRAGQSSGRIETAGGLHL